MPGKATDKSTGGDGTVLSTQRRFTLVPHLMIVLMYVFRGNLYCITIKLTLVHNDTD